MRRKINQQRIKILIGLRIYLISVIVFIYSYIFNFSDAIGQTVGEITVTKALTAVLQANPTVSAIKNTIAAVQDYRNGEEIKDIMKDRAIQMIEDQIPVPEIVLQKVEDELSKKAENL